MKIGQFITEKELLKLGYVKVVKYGSIAFVFQKDNSGIIWNSVDGQIMREINDSEIQIIILVWKRVLSVNGNTK